MEYSLKSPVLKHLLKHHLETSIMDNRGNTALKHAQMQGNEEIIQLLGK